MENKCPFCDPKEMQSRLVLETGSFWVVPTIGQITEGYVLIISKKHAACFGELSEDELREAGLIMDELRGMILKAYGQTPIFFEHGIVGQTVKHPHMHAMPCPEDLGPKIASDFPEYERIKDLQALRETFRREGPYFFYEDNEKQQWLFHVFRRPMYLRILLAEALGVPERANWREMDRRVDEELMSATVAKLRRQL